jgi:hypothetical protein
MPESDNEVFRYLTSPPPPPAPSELKPPPPPPPTTSASSIDVTPTGIVKVCPVLKVIMHFPVTEISIVTAADVVSAKS